MGFILYARGDSASANNGAVNSQGTNTTPTTELRFEKLGPSGDYQLDFNNGASDPDTLLYINGVASFFTVEFSGNLPNSNKFSNINGIDLRGQEVAVITDDATGQRYYFLTDQSLNSFATMDAMPNGAIPLDSVNTTTDVMVCFSRGTRLETPSGKRKIEDLRAGDLVLTENGPQPIRWIGSTRVSYWELVAKPKIRPIRIRAHAFDHNVPENDIILSPNHRIVLDDYRTSLFFGIERALCAVKYLVNNKGIEAILPTDGVEYFHLLFDEHELVMSDNLASESLFMGSSAIDFMGAEAQKNLRKLFPTMGADGLVKFSRLALPELKAHEAQILYGPRSRYEAIAA